jgi:hypothetical protein
MIVQIILHLIINERLWITKMVYAFLHTGGGKEPKTMERKKSKGCIVVVGERQA